jgi:hypothetical protein
MLLGAAMNPENLPVESDAAADRIGTEASADIARGVAVVWRRLLFTVAFALVGFLAAAYAFWEGRALLGLVFALPAAVVVWHFFVSPALTHLPRRPQWPAAAETPHTRSVTRR